MSDTFYVLTVTSPYTKSNVYVCRDLKMAQSAKEELISQGYCVNLEETDEESLTDEERAMCDN